jgi:hypothetical protein
LGRDQREAVIKAGGGYSRDLLSPRALRQACSSAYPANPWPPSYHIAHTTLVDTQTYICGMLCLLLLCAARALIISLHIAHTYTRVLVDRDVVFTACVLALFPSKWRTTLRGLQDQSWLTTSFTGATAYNLPDPPCLT